MRLRGAPTSPEIAYHIIYSQCIFAHMESNKIYFFYFMIYYDF